MDSSKTDDSQYREQIRMMKMSMREVDKEREQLMENLMKEAMERGKLSVELERAQKLFIDVTYPYLVLSWINQLEASCAKGFEKIKLDLNGLNEDEKEEEIHRLKWEYMMLDEKNSNIKPMLQLLLTADAISQFCKDVAKIHSFLTVHCRQHNTVLSNAYNVSEVYNDFMKQQSVIKTIGVLMSHQTKLVVLQETNK